MRWGKALAVAAAVLQMAAPGWTQSLGAGPTPEPADVVTLPAESEPRSARVRAEPEGERWVFLVHGIFMSKGAMGYLEERLSDAGYRVVNRSYPSTRLTIQESAEFLRRRIDRRVAANPRMEVNLVTHSMGGLVARYYLTHSPPEHFGALVQIAPPNQGSEKATRFRNYFYYRMVYRKPGQQLVTGLDELQRELGAPTVPIGIIAGGTGDADGFSPAIPGDDDGTISVQNTKLSTMTDHLVLRYSHAFIMRKRETADQVIHFLKHGQFARATPGGGQDATLVAAE